MHTRRFACMVLAALLALQPALKAGADEAVTLSPAQLDQMMAERHGPLSYRPEPACDAPACGPAPDAGAPLMTAASTGGEAAAGTSTLTVLIVIAVIVVMAVAMGGGGGGSGY